MISSGARIENVRRVRPDKTAGQSSKTVQSWVVGAEGFSGTHTTVILVAWVLSLAWMIWLVVVAWRIRGSDLRRLAR
jgi:hypothetical protein